MASGVTINDIKGNAPDDQKQLCVDVLDFYAVMDDHFAYSVGKRLIIEEVSVGEIVNGKSRSLVVCTITVKEAISISPKEAKNSDDWWGKTSVSQALNVLYHSPAHPKMTRETPRGSTLKIISETVVVGGRAGTIRCEIWDSTNNVLVATGTQTKMPLRNMAIGKL
ncbi:hypothetical protein FRC10_002955 [Ceratobasidium sp. 414]|nr:hypothetical protein FRC10_002955 [Ceratobasidium sp. 414]